MTTPRVYVGCVECRRAGRMVGAWFDALDAPASRALFNAEMRIRLDPGDPHWQHDPHDLFEVRVFDHTGFGDRAWFDEIDVPTARQVAREILGEQS